MRRGMQMRHLRWLLLVVSTVLLFSLFLIAADDAPGSIVLSAPIKSWDEAIPLGNGLEGGLLWGEGNVIRLSLDRGDLWDERIPEIYKQKDWNYATVQRLVAERNQKEMVRLFDAPYEEIPYPTKLPCARLELVLDPAAVVDQFTLDLRQAEAQARLHDGDVSAFFSAEKPVAMMRVRGSSARLRLLAPASLKKLTNPDPQIGGDATSTWLVQEAALGLKYAVFAQSRTKDGVTEIAVAITTNRDAADPLALAKKRVLEALSRGYAANFTPHAEWWRRFWATSSVKVPDANIQQQYDLAQYLYGSGSRKPGPPIALQGVWTADSDDLPPWKGDYHFDLNVQLTYWPYLEAGHFEEGADLLDFMWNLVPVHERFAREFYGTNGIVVPGVMTLDGQPMAGWGQYSLSPMQGAWVAYHFYLHWRYTMDREFLQTRAYPYSRMIAEGILPLLKPDRNGKLKLPLSTSPEIHDNSMQAWLTPNSNYDLALLRSLFGNLHEMANELGNRDDATKWSDILARLDDFATDKDGSLRISPSEALTESHRHHSNLMAIYPLGLLTIEGTSHDRQVVDASLDHLEALGTKNWVGYSFAWASCLESRAGRAEQALDFLEKYANNFVLRNGFHANGDQKKSGLTYDTSRAVTLEGNFAAAQGVQEMLLQSWNGIIRVFPAVSAKWADVSFSDLRAEGGEKVSATRAGGKTIFVRVQATKDGTIRLRNPFGDAHAKWSRPVTPSGADVICRLKAGEVMEGRVEQ